MSAPREIISSLGRRGSRNLATVEYLLEHGPADAVALGEALRLSTAGAHAQLRRLHRAGLLVRLPAIKPHGLGHARQPYAVDPAWPPRGSAQPRARSAPIRDRSARR